MLLLDWRFWLSAFLILGSLGILLWGAQKFNDWGEKLNDKSQEIDLPRMSQKYSASHFPVTLIGVFLVVFVYTLLSQTILVFVGVLALLVAYSTYCYYVYLQYPKREKDILLDLGPSSEKQIGSILFFFGMAGFWLLFLIYAEGPIIQYVLLFFSVLTSFALAIFYLWINQIPVRFSSKGIFIQGVFIPWHRVKKAGWQESTSTPQFLVLKTFTFYSGEITYDITIPAPYQDKVTQLAKNFLSQKFAPGVLPVSSVTTDLGYRLLFLFIMVFGFQVIDNNLYTSVACKLTWDEADSQCASSLDISKIFFSGVEVDYLSEDYLLIGNEKSIYYVPVHWPSFKWFNAKLNHPNKVQSFTLSPDRKRIAVCIEEGNDPEIWIWDLEKRKLIQHFELWDRMYCPVRKEEFIYRPPLIIYPGSETINIINTQAGGEQASFESGTFAVGNQQLAILTNENRIHLIDLTTFRQFQEIELDLTEQDVFPRLALSPDDSLLAILFLNGKLLLIDATTGALKNTSSMLNAEVLNEFHLTEPDSVLVNSVCADLYFSSDGKTLAACAEVDDTYLNYLLRWDVISGQPLDVQEVSYPIEQFAFSPGGKRLLISDGWEKIFFFDLNP